MSCQVAGRKARSLQPIPLVPRRKLLWDKCAAPPTRERIGKPVAGQWIWFYPGLHEVAGCFLQVRCASGNDTIVPVRYVSTGSVGIIHSCIGGPC